MGFEIVRKINYNGRSVQTISTVRCCHNLIQRLKLSIIHLIFWKLFSNLWKKSKKISTLSWDRRKTAPGCKCSLTIFFCRQIPYYEEFEKNRTWIFSNLSQFRSLSAYAVPDRGADWPIGTNKVDFQLIERHLRMKKPKNRENHHSEKTTRYDSVQEIIFFSTF